ncbi:hypothetical protein [Glutamicibacter creatinolyticus]|uniref:hypothetical protein n=1 Tax=Glutamicibacter creatinolyticus TaxID=162496 RepID=UPI0031E04092
MQKLSEGWDVGPAQTTPLVRFEFDTEGVFPEQVVEAGTWDVSRDLTGGGLPSGAAGGSGFAVATANLDFAQPPASLAPWKASARKVETSGAGSLVAYTSGLDSRLTLGRFLVGTVDGISNGVSCTLGLEEVVQRLKRPYRNNWSYSAAMPRFDASKVIEDAAKQAGFMPAQLDVEETGSLLAGVFGVTDQTCWDVIQDIAKATMGAAWLSEDGKLVYRGRTSLRTGEPVEAVEALDDIEELAWNVDRNNAAERVEYSYTPAQVLISTISTLTLWEATNPVLVWAGGRVNIDADIDGTTDRIAPFLPLWDTDTAGPNGVRMSRWAAASQADGGGPRPGNNAISVTAKIVSPSRVRLTVSNNTNRNLWLVDGNGSPCLILRSSLHVRPGESETIDAGASETVAESQFGFDAGQWVQDAATAQEMLSWLSAQTRTPGATISEVRVRPNLSRQLGDIITLTDAGSELNAKALITGVRLQGGPDGVEQRLNLALLDVTFADWDEYNQTHGLSSFYRLDQHLANLGINTFAKLDAWITANFPDQ